LTAKAKLLIVYNTIVLLPALVYFLFWLALSIYSVLASGFLLTIVFSILILVSAIVSSVRLKLRILKETGDPNLKPIKRVYKSASRINLVGYIVFYPIMLSVSFGIPPAVSIFFVVIAMILAIPLRVLISMRKRDYNRISRKMHLGEHKCKRCKVSLCLLPEYRMWVCYRCGARLPMQKQR